MLTSSIVKPVKVVLTDSLIVPECIVKPASFVGLMTVYESNYVRLRQLLPDCETFDDDRVSNSDKDCALYLSCVERQPYTTTIRLTYLFEEQFDVIADPNLTVRIYHDAKLAEAMAHCEEHRHVKLRELASAHSRELDRRWARNMMFNKWLDYLQDMGHDLSK